MSKSKILNEAIVEAKALKQVALQNAKLSLAETFEPKINSMINESLNEQEELEETYSLEEDLDNLQENEELQENEDLQENDDLNESEDEFIDDSEETFGDEVSDDEFSLGDEEGGIADGDEEVGEITVDELKDVLRDVMAELDGSEETFEDEEFSEELPVEDETSFEDDETLNEYNSEEVDFGRSLSVDDNALLSSIKKAIQKSPEFLDKILAISDELSSSAGRAIRSESSSTISSLQEANKILKDTLKEVNLMNAKLLYSNKIFKSRTLSEGQKLKVIRSFDKATNTKDAKKIYGIIKESLDIAIKSKPLKENLSFASKPAGNSTRGKLNESISETQGTVNRWQFLAGIKTN